MEDNFDRFLKIYRRKTYSEMVKDTLEIKSSSISKYEESLKNILRCIDFHRIPPGQLVEQKMILETLIRENSLASKELKESLYKIEKVLNEGK